jgi:hypothetical protein
MVPNVISNTTPNELSGDILEGADAIAGFLFGSKESRRKVCYLAECSNWGACFVRANQCF